MAGRKAKPINEKFFDTWSEQMAYIFGFICSDGNIQKDRNKEVLWFANYDKDIIEQILNVMESESNIYSYGVYVNKTIHRARVTSEYMINRLKELGITQRKSLTLKFPAVPQDFLKHFIRGYFDGNGGFYAKSKGGNITRSEIYCGSEDFVNGLAQAMLSLGLSPKVYFRKRSEDGTGHGNVYGVRCYARDTRKLYSLMYDEATIYMKRKKDKYDGLSSTPTP